MVLRFSELCIDAADIRPTLTWGTHPGTAIAVDAPIPAANDAAAQKGLDYMRFQAGQASPLRIESAVCGRLEVVRNPVR